MSGRSSEFVKSNFDKKKKKKKKRKSKYRWKIRYPLSLLSFSSTPPGEIAAKKGGKNPKKNLAQGKSSG